MRRANRSRLPSTTPARPSPNRIEFGDIAKKVIAEEYPNWEIVTTQFSGEDAQKAVQVPTDIFQTYPDLDAVIAPMPMHCQAPRRRQRTSASRAR